MQDKIEETYQEFLVRYDGFGKGLYERMRVELPEIFDKLVFYKSIRNHIRDSYAFFDNLEKQYRIQLGPDCEVIVFSTFDNSFYADFGDWYEGYDAIGEAIEEIRKETSKDFNLLAKMDFLQFLTYFHLDSTLALIRKFQIRIDLSEKFINNTVVQMTKRIVELAEDLFNEDDTELWILCYEDDTMSTNDSNYLNNLLSKTKTIAYYSGFDENIARIFDDCQHTDTKDKKYQGRTTIIKAKIKNLPITELFYGQITSTMNLKVCLFDVHSSKSFQIYANGICYLWANRERTDLFKLYLKYRHWIPENDIENTKAQFFPKNNIVK